MRIEIFSTSVDILPTYKICSNTSSRILQEYKNNNSLQGERSIKKSDIFKGPIINLTYNYTKDRHRFPFQLIMIAYKSLKVPFIYFFTKLFSFIFQHWNIFCVNCGVIFSFRLCKIAIKEVGIELGKVCIILAFPVLHL